MNSRMKKALLAGIGVISIAAMGACSEQEGAIDASTTGVPGLWGDNASGPAPSRNNTKPFRPKHFSVVLIRLGVDGRPETIHETHKIPAKDLEERVACVLREVSENITDRSCAPPRHPTFPNAPGNQRRNFGQFDFTAQQKIYFYVEGQAVGFNRAYPVSFTPFGPFDVPLKSPTRLANGSFYNGQVIDTIPGFEGVLYLENHFRGEDGTGDPPKDPANKYSMNVHLLVCKSGVTDCDAKVEPKTEQDRAKFVPTIVDPDTGNGTGNGPP